MSIRVDGLSSQYNGYKVNADNIKQEIVRYKEKSSFYDEALISEQGKRALESKI